MTRTVTWHKDTHAHVSALSLPLALLSVLSFCGFLSASLFIYLGVEKLGRCILHPHTKEGGRPQGRVRWNELSTWSGTTRTHAHFSSLSLPLYFGNNNNSLLRSSLPRSSRFSLLRPPLLRLLLLISIVCNATAFSQARHVHAQALLGRAETTRPTKSTMTGSCCCRPNCWFIGDLAHCEKLKV